MRETLTLSSLPHTWVLDLDGTIVKHNGYKIDGKDSFLPGAKEFLESIPEDDMIIILTSRTREFEDITLEFLRINKVRYDHIVFDVPYGERIVINDDKPNGLHTAISVCKERDTGIDFDVTVDEKI